jgi:hypothetical protein
MKMATELIETLPVSKEIPTEFNKDAKHICFKIGIVGDPTKITFGYSKKEFSDKAQAFEFMKEPWGPPMFPENPLDIVFEGQRWLHIGFYPKGNIVFNPSSPGISLKAKPTSGIGGLLHVPSKGPESFCPITDCRHLFLAVSPPGPVYRDAFSLHVDVLHKIVRNGVEVIASLPLIIDPSIKYPGPGG